LKGLKPGASTGIQQLYFCSNRPENLFTAEDAEEYNVSRFWFPAGRARSSIRRAGNRKLETWLLRHSFEQQKFLQTLAGVDLSRIKIAFGIGPDLMDPMKLSGIAARVSGMAYHLPAVAQ